MATSEFPKGYDVTSEENAPPATRKSQIIEEEDLDDIEEVDTFGGPGDAAMNLEDNPNSPLEVTPADELPKAADGSAGQDSKPSLAPPPDLDSSSVLPPRSSSLRRPESESAEQGEDIESNVHDTETASIK